MQEFKAIQKQRVLKIILDAGSNPTRCTFFRQDFLTSFLCSIFYSQGTKSILNQSFLRARLRAQPSPEVRYFVIFLQRAESFRTAEARSWSGENDGVARLIQKTQHR